MLDKLKAVFIDYVSYFDVDNVMVSHKVTHTMHVADNSAQIAKSLALSQNDIELAWILGLLHDFGRFEQFKQYGTFRDSESVDHAELGANLLFGEGYINRFIQVGLPKEELSMIEVAIRQHNKLSLSIDLSERTKLFSQILRDADKIDIFRVVDELPFEQRAGKSINSFVEKDEASNECMKYIYLHKCIPRNLIKSRFEVFLSHVCLAFELCYEESKRIVINQGYLKHLLYSIKDNSDLNEKQINQLEQAKNELEKYLGIAI